MNVMYVDDEPGGLKRNLKSMLQDNFDNVRLEFFSEVDKAIKELKKNPEKYTLVILDLLFPSIDDPEKLLARGLQVIPTVRKNSPGAMIMALSHSHKAGLQAINYGVDDFFEKRLLIEDPGQWIELGKRIREGIDQRQKDINRGRTVFLGHGRSEAWRELSTFLREELGLAYQEFDRDSSAGMTIVARLEEMLKKSGFALLVMTAEDESSDGKLNPRMNVVHEAGLFQGKLGFKRAIILLEEGCEEFSNIHGLKHIPFSPGNIKSSFEDIRRVLKREGLIQK